MTWTTRTVSRMMVALTVAILIGSFVLVRPAGGQSSGESEAGLPPLIGDLLRGRTVILDPGHGGFDPGARGREAIESEINLAIALKLRTWFQMAGAHVLMTWDSPSDIEAGRKYRVRDRLSWINQQRADLLIDIHCNSGASAYRGPQTFYWSGAASYHLARAVQEELQYFTHTRREVKRIDQYVLRYAHMPAINVEVGFITNPEEERRLMDSRYQQDLTWYIFIGTERWLLKGRWPAELLDAPPPTDLLIRD
ncbi:MAG: N-acetylmuramoyl-L-alanine amidase [Firmicutes bacterium]|nr:N-acetylmuramoyl-L-alanine amidase [Bacillota bacterium]